MQGNLGTLLTSTAFSYAQHWKKPRLILAGGWSGSNWARGKSAVNFEFRGAYEGHGGTFFNVSDIVQLDYCSPTGFSKMDVDDVTYCPKPDTDVPPS